MPDLRADYWFSIHFSIELKISLQGMYSTDLLVSGLNEREFPKLSCDFCFLLSIPSGAEL